MVVVDHFSQEANFIPHKENWKADELARYFISHVFQLHGFPERIVSDRGSKLMLQFWTSVSKQFCRQLSLSTAFHPQDDGHLEHINAILED